MDTAAADEGAKVVIAITLDDIVKRRRIVVAQPGTITEAVGEPEHDQDLLTMIDIIVLMAEAVMMKTGSESEALAATAKNPKNARQAQGRNHQLQNLQRMSVIDVLCSYSNLLLG